MAHSLFTLDFLGITTRINVTYREAVRVGELVYLEGTVGRIGSRTGDVSGSIYAVGETGEKIIKCEAEGTYFLDRQNKNQ
jgi:acyl-coenzyme A thioesterase PaaI-like protein